MLFPSLSAAGASAAGGQRARDDDRFGVFPGLGLFVVMDGIGAHGAGEAVAELGLEALRSYFEATRDEPAHPYRGSGAGAARLVEGLRFAHRSILERARVDRGLYRATAGVAAISPSSEGVHVAHAGDSRVYRVAREGIEQLTEDHTLQREARRRMPSLSPEEMAHVPANVLMRALGLGEELEVDIQTLSLRPGDLYLLCTRGLWAALPESEILEVVGANPDLDAVARALVARALGRGTIEDVTCLLVRVEAAGAGGGLR